MTFGGHFGSHIENMKNAYKQLFYAKMKKNILKHQDLFWYIVSSEINKNIAVEGHNASCLTSHGQVFDIFDFREI